MLLRLHVIRDIYLFVVFSKYPLIVALPPPLRWWWSSWWWTTWRASVKGFDGFPFKTALLLSSDVFMTKFSLGIDWSIL